MISEINRLTNRIKNILSSDDNADFSVVDAFPIANRPVPLLKPIVAISVSKVSLSSFSIGDASADLRQKKLSLEWKLTLVTSSDAAHCLALFEMIACKLAFSQEIHADHLDCSQPKFSRDLGGVSVSITVQSSFSVSQDAPPSIPFSDVVVSASLL